MDRPEYFAGVLAAADQALREGVGEISVIEFGVAGGNGLIALQTYAGIVEAETGIGIRVFGFDTGDGLPELCGDFRDHPDQWRSSDFKMDAAALEQRLAARTSLRLGRIADSLPRFIAEGPPPTGFFSCDVDLYSSTKEALQILTLPGTRMLRRVSIYFDDIDFFCSHRFAGELLAIDEFNESGGAVRIDAWRGVKKGRVFADQSWLDKMFVAHDLEAIDRCSVRRPPSREFGLGGG